MDVKGSKVFTDEREAGVIEAREVSSRRKYIDADKALRKIRRHMGDAICRGAGYIPAGKDSDSCYEFLRGYEAGALYISNEMFKNEHLVDAVEVVRCRDCRYWAENRGDSFCASHDGLFAHTKPDDFCSYGERKDE